MDERKPISAIVVPVSVLLAVLLAILALWLSPNDVDRSDVARSGGDAHADRPRRDFKKLMKIVARITRGESYSYAREPILSTLSRAIPRTLFINVTGILAAWGVGALIGCVAGSRLGLASGNALTTALVIGVIIPAPILTWICRLVLVEQTLLGLFDPAMAAAITVAVLATPLIALNQSFLVAKAVRRPDVRFATALHMPWTFRWRLILWHCRSYWVSELALLGVAFCEGSMLVERVFEVKGIGDAMSIACMKSDPLAVSMVAATALLVNLGVVATSHFTANSKRKAD